MRQKEGSFAGWKIRLENMIEVTPTQRQCSGAIVGSERIHLSFMVNERTNPVPEKHDAGQAAGRVQATLQLLHIPEIAREINACCHVNL